LELASLPAALDDPEEVALDRDGPAPGVLRMLWPEADHPAVSIDVGPAQGDELAAPPGRQVGEPGEVLEVVRQRGHEGLKVRALKEALPRVGLEQAAHLDAVRQRAAFLGEPEGLPQQTGLPVDRRRAVVLMLPRLDVMVDVRWRELRRLKRPERAAHHLGVVL